MCTAFPMGNYRVIAVVMSSTDGSQVINNDHSVFNKIMNPQLEQDFPSKHGSDFHPLGPQSVDTVESQISPS